MVLLPQGGCEGYVLTALRAGPAGSDCSPGVIVIFVICTVIFIIISMQSLFLILCALWCWLTDRFSTNPVLTLRT